MHWVFFLVVSIITFAIGALLQKVLVKEKGSDPVVYAFAYQFTITIIATIVALFHGFTMPPITSFPMNFAFLGIFYGVMNILLFKALKLSEASDVSILLSTRAFWTILIALLFLGEIFTVQKWIGAILIFFAVVFANQKSNRVQLEKGSIFALSAAFFFALGSVSDAYLLRFSEPFSYTAFNFGLSALAILLIYPKIAVKLRQLFTPKSLAITLLVSAINYTSVALFALALSAGGKTSQMTPIGQSAVVLTVILAAIFLGERDRLLQKLVAAILVSIAVILLIS